MAQNERGRFESRLAAVTAAAMVAGTGLGLAAVAALAQPVDVTMGAGRAAGGDGTGRVGICPTMYHQVGLGLSSVTNHGDSPVEIVSIHPDSSGSTVRVLDYVVGEHVISGGTSAELPQVPHPHILPAHSTVGLEALVQGSSGSRATGFDVTLRRGSTEATDHLGIGVSFTDDFCAGT